MRLFGGDRVQALVSGLNPDDDVPIQLGLISKQIENAQKKIEARNFEIRKHVLEYDDVINKQRTIIYEQRRTRSGRRKYPRPILWTCWKP